MPRSTSHCLLLLLVLATGLPMASAMAQQPAQRSVTINESMRGTVAAAVLGAMGERFGQTPVKVRIDELQASRASDSHWPMQGTGHFQLEGDSNWERFSFRCNWRADVDGVDFPLINIGDARGPQQVLNDATLIGELEEQVLRTLGSQFPGDAPRLQLDNIRSEQTAGRFLSISATGLIDLGLLGTRPIRVEGAYDQRGDRWLRQQYWLDERLGAL